MEPSTGSELVKAASAVMQAPVATPFIPLGVLGGSLPQETAALAQPELEAPELEPLRPMRASDSGVGTIEIALPNGARVSVEEDEPESLAALLKRMITDGVAVTEFHREERKLEDAFVEMLKKIEPSGGMPPPLPPS